MCLDFMQIPFFPIQYTTTVNARLGNNIEDWHHLHGGMSNMVRDYSVDVQ